MNSRAMRRLLIAALTTCLVGFPANAGDLGAADLSTEQLSSGIPFVGTKWQAWCGTYRKPTVCTLELGENELIIDEKFKLPYTSLIRSESHDAMMNITRLARQDPAWSGWDCYIGEGRGCSAETFANTVLIQYKTTTGSAQAALFAFKENRISDWYGFGNAMRLITLGAKPAKQPTQPVK